MARLADTVPHVASFLSAAGLATAEQAQVVGQEVANYYYKQLSIAAVAAFVPWISKQPCVTTNGAPDTETYCAKNDWKSLLRELKQLGNHFAIRIDLLSVIQYSADGSIEALPSSSCEETVVVAPMSLGTTAFGHPLTAGFRLGCLAGGASGIGVVAAGCSHGDRLFHEIYFVPATGRCFQRFPNGGPIMSADVMPPLVMNEVPTGEVEAWVQITGQGGIYFFRQTCSADLQVSEVFPRSALPSFVSEYYPAVFFMPQNLTTPTRASVFYRGSHLPKHMSGITPAKLEVVWGLSEGEIAEEAETADEPTHEKSHEDRDDGDV